MKEKIILLFNKTSNRYMALLLERKINRDKLKDKYFKFKYVEMDPELQVWQGDFETGKIITIAEDTTPEFIDEYMLNTIAQKKIEKGYSESKQLNLIAGMLEAISKKLEMSEEEFPVVSEFNDMMEYIKHVRENNARYKLGYAKSPFFDYHSKEDIKKAFEDEIEGGFRQVVPKPQLPIKGNPRVRRNISNIFAKFVFSY